MSLLSVKNLEAFYGDIRVLHGVDFAVAAGGVSVLLGANGAGKTTALRALSGMIRIGGEVVFNGGGIAGKPADAIARLGIAHVPEGRGTFTRMTTLENLMLGAITRRDHAGIAADIEACFELFPRLKERRAQQAGTLSGGEQQMLAVCRALMLRPRLMLLDEPSFGLAPLMIEELFRALSRLNRERGLALLIVEQNADIALSIANDAFVLESGEVVMWGPAKMIAANPAVHRSYLGY